MTLEAIFHGEGHYLLRANIDPRLFLSSNPTSLPPVDASWYRDQSADQLRDTEAKAADYLRRAVVVTFGGTPHELTEVTFLPMDGATNEPLSATSQEVHLLAKTIGQTGRGPFQVRLGAEANTSLILLTTVGDEAERRPMVIFPGETSLGIAVPLAPQESPKGPAAEAAAHGPWWLVGAMAVLLLIGWACWHLTKRWRREPRKEVQG